jgi:hypothetical protein
VPVRAWVGSPYLHRWRGSRYHTYQHMVSAFYAAWFWFCLPLLEGVYFCGTAFAAIIFCLGAVAKLFGYHGSSAFHADHMQVFCCSLAILLRKCLYPNETSPVALTVPVNVSSFVSAPCLVWWSGGSLLVPSLSLWPMFSMVICVTVCCAVSVHSRAPSCWFLCFSALW